ncbi:MAG: diguanylate cyclase [Psychromonas sp.]
MAQHKELDNRNSGTANFESQNYKQDSKKDVLDIAKYQQPEEKVTSEQAAFEQVMKQMNIPDRSGFDRRYEQLWQEAGEEKELLSVLICEIDFFKAYHDNYGDQGTSFMLLVVGLALKNACEDLGCYLARYQGDKFAILIKGSDVAEAQDVAEKLRLSVEKSRTEHKFSDVNNVVTLSIGVSSIYPTSLNMLMREADMALSSAKSGGHNQVSGNFDQKIIKPVGVEEPQEESSDFSRFMAEMGIAQRKDFNEEFLSVWKAGSEDNELVSLVMCELDCFKAYVDNFGQQPSEDFLLIIGCTFNSICEELGCFMAHLEGENFAILIKGGNATKAFKAAEMLRVALNELDLAHPHSTVSDIITMSMGLSSIYPGDSNSMKILMSKAKIALEDAKSAGKAQLSVN